MPKSNDRRRPHHAAHTLFFPAAALYAAIILPLSVYAIVSGRVIFPGLGNPLHHAHEMLFGFAPAVVAGFLINRVDQYRLWLLCGLWVASRFSFLLLPESFITSLLNIGFATLFVVTSAVPFLQSAKKWRNQIFAPTIITLGLALTV